MLVFLIGFMGAGKTTLGNALSQQLGWHFIDLDKEIERQSGCTVPELFARSKEPAFRKMEQQVLHTIVRQLQDPLSTIKNSVIACGGGTPCYKQNLALMKASGFVIYLEVAPEILCKRLLDATTAIRPMIPTHDPEQLLPYIRHLLDQRRPVYEAAHWKC